MRQTLTHRIVERLEREADALTREFASSSRGVQTRHVAIDNLLPVEIAREFYPCFPPKESMRHVSSFREHKYTFKQLDQVPSLLKDITLCHPESGGDHERGTHHWATPADS
jgi:hypothetical protein